MARVTFDELFAKQEPIIAPGAWNALAARVFERHGARCLTVGGWITGASLCVPEPLMTMTEQIETAGRVARAVNIPVIVDAHTGYGEPVHVMRAIREFEAAGIDCVHLEDQHFPKRAHYHQARKHVVSREAMVEKLHYALRARRSSAFKIVARTDVNGAIGGSIEETIIRMNLYKQAGADILMPFPSPGDNRSEFTLEVLKKVRDSVPDIPMVWVAGEARTMEEPDVRTVFNLGYQIITFPTNFFVATVQRTMELFDEVKSTGRAIQPNSEFAKHEIEGAIGLNEMYAVERETTERPQV